MSDDVISAPSQLDPDRLTTILRKSGALETGDVRTIQVAPLEGTNSRLARLRVEYDPNAAGQRPDRLLLKLCAGELFGVSEVNYYARDYAAVPDAPIPRCYDAVFSGRERRYHILMEDLFDTHRPGRDVELTETYGNALAISLARLHLPYWNGERLDSIGEHLPTDSDIERSIDPIRPGVEPLIEASRGWIDSSWPDLIRRAVDRHPKLLKQRACDRQGFTLVHGDPNPGNILAPRDGSGSVFLIDRQPFTWSLTVWLGISDIAYAMVHWWDTPARRRLEMSVLRAYHRALAARGIDSYPWERLLLDYRLCAVQSLYVPILRCTEPGAVEAMRWVWVPQLQKAMTALLDLDCAAFW